VNGDRVGTWSKGVIVPDFGDEKLASSSLIVADVMEPVAVKNVGTGDFVIGTNKVRPRVPPADGKPVMFRRNQKVNFQTRPPDEPFEALQIIQKVVMYVVGPDRSPKQRTKQQAKQRVTQI
jgi:hypothetical protein